eukprot:TRINITY_DN4212_c0_g2_i1.p1 TRINITY_DN4212_c0_g2~~TRINITY_DN4212_c0_g2_i1.p1  ORF type:complete len:356 (-),score=60.05 TRINITY_DN4212_c0_g2_i1:54-1121(-)
MIKRSFFAFIYTVFLFISLSEAYGDDIGHYNNSIAYTLLNMLRVDPVCYRDAFIDTSVPIFEGWYNLTELALIQYFDRAAPLMWSSKISDSAVRHLYDNVNDCDGSLSPLTCNCESECSVLYRCKAFEYEGQCGVSFVSLAPNAAIFLAGQACGGNNLAACKPDNQSEPILRGRVELLKSIYNSVGVGYYYKASSSYLSYWEYVLGVVSTTDKPVIYGGSHIISSSKIDFYSVYYGADFDDSPDTFKINVGGTSYDMSAFCGNTYTFSMATIPDSCVAYYFEATKGGNTYRYPDNGKYYTYGENCEYSYENSSGESEVEETEIERPITPGEQEMGDTSSVSLLTLLFTYLSLALL